MFREMYCGRGLGCGRGPAVLETGQIIAHV